MSRNGRLLWVTEASRRLLGWTMEAAGGDAYAGAPPEDRDVVRDMHEQIESGEHLRLCAPVVTAAGDPRLAEWRVTRRRGRIYTFLIRLVS